MNQRLRSVCLTLTVLAALPCCHTEPTSPRPARAQAPPTRQRPPAVAVRVRQATASWTNGTLVVACDVTLVNNTGRPLRVLTNFQSAYDGFTVIVRHPQGGLVARQSYVYHQSPYAQDRVLPLPPGSTDARIQFPVTLKTKPEGPLQVRLEGGLRGTKFARGIISNLVSARWIKP
ncbi:MAG: hypothetical protein ABI333_18740 [bacterium]